MINLEKNIQDKLGINLGKNKKNELARLVFEIHRGQNVTVLEIIDDLINNININKIHKGDLFNFSKKYLLKRRFPMLTKKQQEIKPYLPKFDLSKKTRKEKYDVNIKPENVYLVKEIRNDKFTQNFLSRLPKDVNISYIDSLKDYRILISEGMLSMKKRDLFISKEKYDLFKPCPCTRFHLRCGYQIMNLVFGCPMDCSYCYLQQYQNFPGIIINSNLEKFFLDFENIYKKSKQKFFRLGTGEFTDSFAFDEYTHYSKKLVEFFRKKQVFFELKTKTDNIDLLLDVEPAKNIVISWSLNPQDIINSQELYTSSLKNRLESAKKCYDYGYSIGFHFDPIIYYPQWKKEYGNLIDKLFNAISGSISWISLGTLRFNPKLKTIIESRFPNSDIIYSELIIGEDSKLRYPKFIRKEIYEYMIKKIRFYDKKANIYLCMESFDMWSDVLKEVKTDIENYIIYQALKNNNVEF